MKIARREFVSLYILLAATHVFSYIFILSPMLVSSAWLPIIMALLLALPVILTARTLAGKAQMEDICTKAMGNIGARIFYILVLVIVMFNARVGAVLFSSSVLAYTADLPFDRSVVLIVLIVAGLCAYIGDMAVSNCARIALLLLMLTMGVLLLGTISHARLEHFLPILGPGLGDMTRSAPQLAGKLLLPMLYIFRADMRDAGMKRALTVSAALSALLAAASLAIYTLSQPTLPAMPDTMAVRVSMLMNNGTSGIQLQLPLILIWNICQMLILSAQLALCGALLRMAVPRIKKMAVPVITTIIAAICLMHSEVEDVFRFVNVATYPAIAVCILFICLLHKARSKREGRKADV